MSQIVVVYHSGYGHTQRIAQEVASGADAALLAIDADGNLPDGGWEQLAAADAIVFGTPTYMGGPSWQFKKFADASSKPWFARAWQDKFFAGFSVSARLNGDKGQTLAYLNTLAAQHGGLWISLGLPPANKQASSRQDVNNLGGSVGLLVPAPSDAGADAIPAGDVETARKFGERVAAVVDKFKG